MKRCLFLLLLGSLSLLIVAEAKNQKETLPAVFKNAVFVYVQAYNGDAINPRVYPTTGMPTVTWQQALKALTVGAVYDAIRPTWCFWFARDGSSVTPGVEVGIGRQPQNRNPSQPDPTRGADSTGVGVGVDAEAGPPDDLLSIYMVGPSTHSSGRISGGLDAPGCPSYNASSMKWKRRIRNEAPALRLTFDGGDTVRFAAARRGPDHPSEPCEDMARWHGAR